MNPFFKNNDDSQTPHWAKTLHQEGKAAFLSQGLPTPKTEAWKYTKLRELETDDYEFAPLADKNAMPKEEFPFACAEIDFLNGQWVKTSNVPQGLTIKPLSEALAQINQIADILNYPFAALNSAYLEQGVFIEVAANRQIEMPLVLCYHTIPQGHNFFENIRNIVVLNTGSQLDLVEYYSYTGEVKSRYFVNQVNEITVKENAQLNHYKFQNEAYKANHIALHAVNVETGGTYKSFCLQKGANIARNETKVKLKGLQAKAQVDGAYVMNGWATLDTTTDIEHLFPQTTSSQLIKGVVGGDAKGVFQGKIHIAPNAVQTEGTQLHKALLLSDTAEIDVKPELEIFADDVKCSHGAASGELDEEQLFYMQSRGISREDAKKMLIDAYLEDVFARIENENLRAWFKDLKQNS